MSEFIAVCPKCRQQILCDTAYVGLRIACPMCMQEISMPAPTQQTPLTGHGASAPPVQAPAPAGGGKGNPTVLIGIIAGAVVILAVAAMLIFRKGSAPAPSVSPSQPAPVATQTPAPTAVATPAPAPAPTTVQTPKPAVPSTPGSLDQVRASWSFDQDSGSSVIDKTGNGNSGTIVGGNAIWLKSTDPDGAGLRLNGTNCVEIPGPVVDTAQSFTVAARVYLDKLEPKKYQTIVGIDGKEISGFYLQMNPYAGGGTGRFEFDRMEGDDKSATKVAAKDHTSISINTWYQLVGVYDADAQSVALYMNGKLQDTFPYTHSWQATGLTTIGRGKVSGHGGNFLTGVVRDVRFYAFAMTPEQVKKISK